LYNAKYDDGDEEDMSISDIRKHVVEKEKVNKKVAVEKTENKE